MSSPPPEVPSPSAGRTLPARAPFPSPTVRPFWSYVRGLLAPAVIWGLVVAVLARPVEAWLMGQDSYDQDALKEWLDESRGARDTLPEMVERYLKLRDASLGRGEAHQRSVDPILIQQDLGLKNEEIREHLRSLGSPLTKLYGNQVPLFPTIYTLQVQFDGTDKGAITWDSELPVRANQYKELTHRIHPRAVVYVRYQLHAYSKRQREEHVTTERLWRLTALAAPATVLGLTWVVMVQRRERRRERQQAQAEFQAAQNERLLTQEQRRHEDTERALLEQRLATQVAEQRALELKSQMFANISIMAGSYAHNIKNLLVRPNDLLSRCLEAASLSHDQEAMLHEVRETLGTVTERLQQILRTVRRDPTRAEPTRLDLNAVVRDLERTWRDLGRDRWKLDVALDLTEGPCAVAGDLSHLQQAIENLLFNARDATFEQRVRLRDQAHRTQDPARKQALIAAAAWRGRVVLRTRRSDGAVILEVSDNGAGMTEEVRRRCTEPHFSTKRDNALFEGLSTGMGLGLAFVVAVLEHHQAALEIDSEPGRGTTFRARFPAAPSEAQA
jgi:signal transduction histidine kinase